MPKVEEAFMPTPKRTATDAKESSSTVVAREMPDWQIVTPEAVPDFSFDEETMKIDPGPSIAKLRQKFGLSDAKGKDFAPVDTSVETVRIQPKKGGPAKTADIKNGKITIVQG